MNNSAAKVGEIFREAGTAFNKLSEMTLMLQPTDDSSPGRKWSDAEVEMLRGCINRFAVELNKISQHIKNRTMRHLVSLLEMDSGTIQDISSSPQHLTQEPQPEEEHILETDSQCDFNETFVNVFSQGFPVQVKDEDIDQFLRHFDPSVVDSTPPIDFMQEDSNRQHPPSEFEDFQDSSYDITLRSVPSLISLLDADVNNANYSERNNSTESGMANNIGTLHAEFPYFGFNVGESTGGSRNFQVINYNYTSLVSREEHFSLRQAQDTWNHVSSTATNQTMVVPFTNDGDSIFYTGSIGQNTCVQASDETGRRVNESHFNNERGSIFYTGPIGQNTSVQASDETGLWVNESHFNNERGSIFYTGSIGQNTSVQASDETGLRVNESHFNNERGSIFYTGSIGQTTSVQASDETALTEKKKDNESHFNNERGSIFYTGSIGQTTSVQASDETALTEKKKDNESHFKNDGDSIFYTGSIGQTTSVQASDETALTEKKKDNESHFKNDGDSIFYTGSIGQTTSVQASDEAALTEKKKG